MGLIQQISILLDSQSKAQLVADFREAAAKGATALRQEFERKLADNRVNLASGLINEREFKAANQRVADSLKTTIIARMRELQDTGKDTGREYTQLGGMLRRVTSEGAGQVGLMNRAWSSMKMAVASVGGAIAGAFAIKKLVDFGKAAIGAAIESERALTATRGAVESLGLSWDTVGPQVEAAAKRIQESTRFDDEATLRGFTTVLDLTQDYGKSLAALGPIADFAVAKNLSFEEASTIVGKALTGNTTALGKYIPAVRAGADVMESLGQFSGRAAADLSTFGGGLDFLKNQWSEFTETLGKVFVSSTDGVGALEMLSKAVQAMTAWVAANEQQISRWVSAGLRFAMGELKVFAQGTGNVLGFIRDSWNLLMRGFANAGALWKVTQINFATFVQQMLGLVLKLQGAMLRLAEAMPGSPFAAQIRRAMEQTSDYIGKLGTFVAETSVEMRKDLGTDDTGATKTTSIGGGMAANIEAGAEKGAKSFGKVSSAAEVAAQKAAEKWEAFLEKFRASMDSSVAASGEATKAILASLDDYLSAQREVQDKANSDFLKGLGETVGKADAARDDSRRRQLEAELAANTAILQSATATQEAKREAFERSADIQVELAALAARKTLKAGDSEAVGRENAEARKRQALIESGLTAEEVNAEMAKGSGKAAEDTRDSWLDALNVMNGAFQNLSKLFGGALQGIVDGMGQVVGAASAIASGIAGIGTKIGGLTGLLTKLAGGASVIGGIITAAGIAIDIIKGLGEILGLGDSEWARENQRSTALYHIATQPRPSAARTAALAQLADRAINLPDPGNRANAKLLYEDALLILAGKKEKAGFEGPTGVPTSPTAPPPTGGTDFGGSTPPTPTAPPPTSTPTQDFQHGGWVRWTGPANVHAGEMVLPSTLAQQLLSVAGMQSGSRVSESHVSTDYSTDNRSIVVNLYGVMDRDIPQAVVNAISERLGHDFQKHAMLQGNASLPR